uniref:Fe2OG dioxygenase domain-containing protein n=1 Tax=Phaeomonas parva TaxID=124430 RepID=A0A7S1TXS7_9STRA|mmetsp:Transcript_22065/g.67769  ORF Transcript_22065/g.67769 Transcript_22065/m.67769 type:complete len:461 (+) Transcript_22065:67-1449(+)
MASLWAGGALLLWVLLGWVAGQPGAAPKAPDPSKIPEAYANDMKNFRTGLIHAFLLRGLPFNYAEVPEYLHPLALCASEAGIACPEQVTSSAHLGRTAAPRSTLYEYISQRDPRDIFGFDNADLPQRLEVRPGLILPEVPMGSLKGDKRRGNILLTSEMKLSHDAQQLDYLVDRGRLPGDFRDIAAYYRATIARFKAMALNSTYESWLLDQDFHRNTYHMYGMAVYYPLSDLSAPLAAHGSALAPRNWTAVEEAYMRGEVLAIDGFLREWAYRELYRFCLEATVYYEVKPNYLGAYWNEGFGHSLLEQVALELRRAFPNAIGDLPLINVWSYKYGQRDSRGGIAPHCDAAIVNVNFWLAPDSANLDPTSGGLRIYVDRLDEEDIMKVNSIAGTSVPEGARYKDVPHRCNRAVIFDSDLLHETMPFHFKEGYEHMRINLTFLFGEGTWKRGGGEAPTEPEP